MARAGVLVSDACADVQPLPWTDFETLLDPIGDLFDMKRRAQVLYFLLGYLLPVAGVILGIVFLIFHGQKFGRRGVEIQAADGTITKVNGPGESYVMTYWVLACLQMVFVFSNIVGPCQVYRRLHFPWQLIGLVCDAVYVITVNTGMSTWPQDAVTGNPHLYFGLAAGMQFIGQCVLTWGAYRISGLGLFVVREDPNNRANKVEFEPVFGRRPPRRYDRVRAHEEEEEDDNI